MNVIENVRATRERMLVHEHADANDSGLTIACWEVLAENEPHVVQTALAIILTTSILRLAIAAHPGRERVSLEGHSHIKGVRPCVAAGVSCCAVNRGFSDGEH